MKKIVSICIIFGLSFLLVSCRVQKSFDFLNHPDEITDISIVTISFGDNDEPVLTELEQIFDKTAFLKDFADIDCFAYFGDPSGVSDPDTETAVIKISYRNDEYELINWNGQAKYTLEKGFNFYAGYSVFDKAQFDALLQKYLEKF